MANYHVYDLFQRISELLQDNISIVEISEVNDDIPFLSFNAQNPIDEFEGIDYESIDSITDETSLKSETHFDEDSPVPMVLSLYDLKQISRAFQLASQKLLSDLDSTNITADERSAIRKEHSEIEKSYLIYSNYLKKLSSN